MSLKGIILIPIFISNIKHPFLILMLLLLAFSIYIPALFHSFVYPDTVHVVQNKFIKDISYIPMYFSSEFSRSANLGYVPYYRPLFPLSFLIDYKLWGLNPMGFHLTNILYHAFSVAVLYIVVMMLFKDRRAAFLSSALFALHPVHTEAVDWISGRPDVQAGFFYLLSFIFYFQAKLSHSPQFTAHGSQYRQYLPLLLSSISFFLALLSKEMAVTLPIVLILYEIVFERSDNRKFSYILPSVFVLATYFLMRYLAIGAFFGNYPIQMISDIPPDHGDIFARLMTTIKITASYFRLLVLPFEQKAYYTVSIPDGITDVSVEILVVALTSIALISAYRNSKMIFFPLSFIILTLLPVLLPIAFSSQFAQTLMSERYLYIPSMGFCILAGLIFVKAFDRLKALTAGKSVFMLLAVCCSLLVFYGALTLQRHTVWKDEEVFFKNAVIDSPDSALSRYNLALWYYTNGMLNEAKKEFKLALILNKNRNAVEIASEEAFNRLFEHGLPAEETLSLLRRSFILNPPQGEGQENERR